MRTVRGGNEGYLYYAFDAHTVFFLNILEM